MSEPTRGPGGPRFPKIEVVSFDAFGTLVDVGAALDAGLEKEGGIGHASQRQYVLTQTRDAEWELLDELETFLPYRDVLAQSLVRGASRAGSLLGREAADRIVATPGEWPLYPDAGPALARLAERFRIALVANFDRADIARVAARLGIEPARIVAAPDVEAYLPEPDLHLALLHELELDEDQLLHASSDPERDLYTTEDLGIPAAFIDRHGDGLPEDLTVALRVRDLAGLAERLFAGTRRRPEADGGAPRAGAGSKPGAPRRGTRPPRRT